MGTIITSLSLIAIFILLFPLLNFAVYVDDMFFSYSILNNPCQNRTLNESDCFSITLLTYPENSNLMFVLKVFGDAYIFYLNAYESSIFTSDANVTVEEKNGAKRTAPSSNFHGLPIYEGSDTESTTYACLSFVNNIIKGFLMLKNGSSIYIESLDVWNSTISNKSFEIIAYKASDVKFKDCILSSDNLTNCHENGFSGSLHCSRINRKQISCFLNSNESKNTLLTSYISDHLSSKTTQKPPVFTSRNASCTLFLSADSSYFARHGYDLEKTLVDMILNLKHVNRLFSLTDFDSDGYEDGFIFRIGEVIVRRSKSLDDDNKKLLNENPLSLLVKHFRKVPQDLCLALQFVSIPTESNWMSTSFGGGICKNNDMEPEPAKNVAIINTVDAQNVARPLMATAWTAAMAVGHVLGSAERVCDTLAPHPPETDWTSFFTDCGRHNIANLLERNGFCLDYPEEERKHFPILPSKESEISSCGNLEIDPGEECDCGTKEECSAKSSCCIPPGEKNECHYDSDKGYECDWSDDCCTRDCKIIPKSWKVFCGFGEPSCSPSQAYCDGHSPHCPVPRSAVSLKDGEMCGPATLKHAGAATCKTGHCNSTVCQDAGLEDCTCAVESGEECRVCCKKLVATREGEESDALCVPAEYFGLKPKKGKIFYRYPGTPCNEVRLGHCDRNGVCTQYQAIQVSGVPVIFQGCYSAIISFFLLMRVWTVILK